MDKYDPAMAARVWQRVRQGERSTEPVQQPQLPADSLPELISGAWQTAAIYLQLSRRMKGRDAQRVRMLFEQEQEHAACLRGIYTVMTGKKPVVRTAPPGQERTEAALRRCFEREKRAIEAYESRSADRDWGPVFARLAQQEREHCRLILEILGRE